MRTDYFAVMNRAAGGGRCGRMAEGALEKLCRGGIQVELTESRYPGHGSELAHDAYQQGFRRFIAMGGDGTSYEIINGLFPQAQHGDPVTLAFQPLGTGNSFLYDFTDQGVTYATQVLLSGKTRPCDVMCLTYQKGHDSAEGPKTDKLHFLNLLSVGYTADVAAMTNRYLKGWGPTGYLLGILFCLLKFRRSLFSLRLGEQPDFETVEPTFLAFCNSQFTGGRMHLAPDAKTDSGLIETIRCDRLGYWELLRNLPNLYDGSYMKLSAVSRSAVSQVEFDLDAPIDVVIDGEILHLHCLKIEVLPGALQIAV